MFDPSRRTRLFTVPLLVSCLSACLSVPEGASPAGQPTTVAPAQPPAAQESAVAAGAVAKAAAAPKKTAQAKNAPKKKSTKVLIGEKEEQLTKLERGLHYAQLELKIATKKSAADAVASELEAAEARRKVELAQAALETFTTLERPLKDEENDLSVERAKRRLVEAREELAGILQIYSEEVEAPAKDEVIRRHERSVEFAERSLTIAQRKVEVAEQATLTPKLEGLEWALATANNKLEQANEADARKTIQRELDVLRKEHALDDKDKEITKAEKELTKLKATLKKENARKAAARKKKEDEAKAKADQAKAAEGAGS